MPEDKAVRRRYGGKILCGTFRETVIYELVAACLLVGRKCKLTIYRILMRVARFKTWLDTAGEWAFRDAREAQIGCNRQ